MAIATHLQQRAARSARACSMRNTVPVPNIALQRGNGLVIRKGMHEQSSAAERQFVYELPQPTAEL